MRRIRLGGQGVRMWTPPMQRAETKPPKRKAITGWTKGAAQRNRAFLMSVDPFALSRDLGFAVTLTLGATPVSAAVWGDIIHRFLTTLRRCGMIRYHWVTEWTRKGRPHLHLTFFLKGRAPIAPSPEKFTYSQPVASPLQLMKARASGDWSFLKPILRHGVVDKVIGPRLNQKFIWTPSSVSDWFTDWIVADAVFTAWQRACNPIPCHHYAQHVERIEALSGWQAYVAKHCARGINHYQRLATVLPERWTSSGRLWGKGGDWPARSDNLELDAISYFRLRRVIRKWLLAKASVNAGHAFGRKSEQARHDLRYLRKAGSKLRIESSRQQDKQYLSSVLGLSSFIPRDLIDMLLVWAIDHPNAVLIDADTGEVHTNNEASDKAILDRYGMLAARPAGRGRGGHTPARRARPLIILPYLNKHHNRADSGVCYAGPFCRSR